MATLDTGTELVRAAEFLGEVLSSNPGLLSELSITAGGKIGLTLCPEDDVLTTLRHVLISEKMRRVVALEEA